MERQPPQWLEVGEDRRRLAFLMQEGEGAPVVWLGGFRSDMRATKAEALADWARETAGPICASTMAAMARAKAISATSPSPTGSATHSP